MTYAQNLRKTLESHADADNARAMSAYMKGHFPFFGIKSEARRGALKEFIAGQGLPSVSALEATVRELWQMPEREIHYCAQELADKVWRKPPPNALDLYVFMIVQQSWWDSVDMIATKLVGNYFTSHPEQEVELSRQWCESENLWLRRTAILFQLKRKAETNWPLLQETITSNLGDPDFFIRKAIGWALREYAKTDAEAVIQFVESHPQLSALSTKEALKNMRN